jgi:hypothetical protein
VADVPADRHVRVDCHDLHEFVRAVPAVDRPRPEMTFAGPAAGLIRFVARSSNTISILLARG